MDVTTHRRAWLERAGVIVALLIGLALAREGQTHGVLWITGDTVLYDGVRQVADRLQVDTAPSPPGMRALPGHRGRCATP